MKQLFIFRNCFEKGCARTLFPSRKELIDHFHEVHLKTTSLNGNRDRMDGNLAFNESRYNTCPDCGEKFPNFNDVVTHCGRRHQERITQVIRKFGVDKMLNPIKR